MNSLVPIHDVGLVMRNTNAHFKKYKPNTNFDKTIPFRICQVSEHRIKSTCVDQTNSDNRRRSLVNSKRYLHVMHKKVRKKEIFIFFTHVTNF